MSFGVYEEKCRKIFQELFKKEFKSVRPDWLKNLWTYQNLELDGYNPDIVTPIGKGLAFEYDGVQHSRFTPLFHSCVGDFEYQVMKDSLKDEMCRDEGVILIRIPHYVCYWDLKPFIIGKLIMKGVKID